MAGAFPSTRYSVIQRIRSTDPSSRRGAFDDLVTGYWKPVYKYLRLTWHLSGEDAEDLTQAFFSDAFEKAWLERFDPERARFRTFVRLCADRLVMNWRQSESRLKRGGAVETVALDFAEAERELLAHHASTPPEAEELFRREFIRSLFDRAVAAVRAEYESAGRSVHLRLFERYDLAPVEGLTYADLASEFGLTTTQVTNYLAQIRRSFRTRALESLETLTGTREEFRREARELFGMVVE
jgi:RNA polymerase sigma factor (sigma-70 family)